MGFTFKQKILIGLWLIFGAFRVTSAIFVIVMVISNDFIKANFWLLCMLSSIKIASEIMGWIRND